MDTGFSGHLTLPASTIATLGLTKIGDVPVILGDGSEAHLLEYEAVFLWDGSGRDILVYEADSDSLLGMQLLYCFDFHIHVVDGGMVALNRLP